MKSECPSKKSSIFSQSLLVRTLLHRLLCNQYKSVLTLPIRIGQKLWIFHLGTQISKSLFLWNYDFPYPIKIVMKRNECFQQKHNLEERESFIIERGGQISRSDVIESISEKEDVHLFISFLLIRHNHSFFPSPFYDHRPVFWSENTNNLFVYWI